MTLTEMCHTRNTWLPRLAPALIDDPYAWPAGRYVALRYKTHESPDYLEPGEALAYATWLAAGHTQTHRHWADEQATRPEDDA
ncbi:MAG TPA: hypothetical protein VF077_12345 [Nitrospiraceae bacterium]